RNDERRPHARLVGRPAPAPDEQPAGAEQRRAGGVEAGVEQRERRHQRTGAGLRPVAEQQIADDQHDRERDAADHHQRRSICRGRHNEVAKSAMAATPIRAVASQPSTLSHRPLTLVPMMVLLWPPSRTRTSSGGARSRWSTADRKSIRIGFVPPRLSIPPATIAPARTR